MFRLEDHVALITGASRGIGRATALRLSAQGAAVVLAARSVDALEELAEEIRAAGGRAHALALDLSQTEEIATALGSIPEDFQPIDVVVNNAGITADSLVLRMSLEQWQSVLNTNLTGAWAVTKPLLRGMMRRRWGRIINITSVVGLMGNAGQANYAAAKAGLVGLTKSLARELASRSITVNAVAPGFIETAMTEALPAASREVLADQIPLGRLGGVDDIAAAVVFLASEEAGYVTGHVLNVSGGMYI